MSEWIADRYGRSSGIEHLGGISYLDSPVPRRWHRCRPQTRGWIDMFIPIERCACGARRLGGPDGMWLERNSRKRIASIR